MSSVPAQGVPPWLGCGFTAWRKAQQGLQGSQALPTHRLPTLFDCEWARSFFLYFPFPIFTLEVLGQILSWFCRTCHDCWSTNQQCSHLSVLSCETKQMSSCPISPVPLIMPLYRKSRLLSSGVGWKSQNSSGFFCAGVICRSLSLPALPVRRELLRVLGTAVICSSW